MRNPIVVISSNFYFSTREEVTDKLSTLHVLAMTKCKEITAAGPVVSRNPFLET